MSVSDKPIDEVNLRLYEVPSSLSGRPLIRKIALSIGLVQPNDSRDVVTDVLWALLIASKELKWLSSLEIEEKVKDIRSHENLGPEGTAGSNIRRILKQLRDFGLVERHSAKYRILEFAPLEDVFEVAILKKTNKFIRRAQDYMRMI